LRRVWLGPGLGLVGMVWVGSVKVAVLIVVSVADSVKRSLLRAKEKPQTLWAAARWMAWILF
jgi:hypothetical protein